MKILVMQLARLGDILMTWPQIRALRRQYPDAQIDLLIRPRFKEAAQGLSQVDHLIEFPVENIFEPLLGEPLHFNESLDAINQIISTLRESQYDWIINSTLSPASSYLTYELKTQRNKITGYTRTSDGYLSIPDDVSAYIYAQVGIDRSNRIHLSDLFTLMTGTQPTMMDWVTPVTGLSPAPFEDYIVIHVGASQEDKKLSAFKWRTFLTHFQKLSPLPVVLIGNEAEQKDADFISLGFSQEQVINLTGQLKFQELFPLIKKAKLYLGADSAPLHVASLVGTPALNVSLGTVNFWETGPKSLGSRVLYATTEADIPSEKIATEALQILNNIQPSKDSIYFIDKSPSYYAPANARNDDWTWNMIQALYMDGQWPEFKNNTQLQGLKNLREVNLVMMEQFQTIRQHQKVDAVSAILQRCEEVMESIGRLVPELTPLLRWYQTQKSLIPPLAPQEILNATEKVHQDLDHILNYWMSLNETRDSGTASNHDQKVMED